MNYKRVPLGNLWTNGYLFWDDGKQAFFVDPGGDPQEVFDFLKQQGLSLLAVLLTHGHIDHIAGIEEFPPLVGDNIYIADGDAGLLREPPLELQQALRVECGGLQKFKTVKDGDVLSIGDFKIDVIATPGHTPGGVCYLVHNGDEKILLSGDTLFAQSVGRTDLNGGDMDLLNESLRKLARLDDDMVVLPGHGPDTTIGRERVSNPFWPE